eukprot:jgi/Psemu1/10544/gm1.10544_g
MDDDLQASHAKAVYIRQLFSAFHSRGVPYNQGYFKHRGGFVAVVNKDWKDKKIEDPTLGSTKRNKAKFDEFVDEKFKKVIDDGTYKPYEDMLDLLKLMTIELGRQFRICGKKELVFLKWDYLKLGTFSHGAMKDLKYIIINPKTANINFKPKSPVGADTIRKWVRDFAEVADFKDWEKAQRALSSGLHKHDGKKLALDNNNNKKKNNNNKPPIAPSTKKVIINVDQQDKENIPVPQDTKPAVVLGTKEPFPSKDTLKKEVQKWKTDSKELKKENKKQRTKLQDAEDNVAQLTIDLKEFNNTNKTLSHEQLEKQKDLHEKELLHQQTELSERYTKALEDAKKIATKEAADKFKLSKMEDIELEGKQNEIDQLHRQMNQNQCAIILHFRQALSVDLRSVTSCVDDLLQSPLRASPQCRPQEVTRESVLKPESET